MQRHATSVLAAAVLIAPVAACANIALIPSTRDNTLIETPDGSLSNGAGPNFFAGTTSIGDIRRGLVYFDVAAHVPVGSIVTSVSLTLHMSRTPAAAEVVSLHSILADWGEGGSIGPMGGGGGAPSQLGDATWLHRFYPDQPWTSAGGDFDEMPLASEIVVGIGSYTWDSNAALVALTQQWVDGTSPNFGFLVRGEEALASTAKRFDSRENSESAFRPVLVVEFTPIPAPSTAIAVLAVLSRPRRRIVLPVPVAGRRRNV